MRAEADWNVLDPDVLGWKLEAAPREQLVRELFDLRRILEPAIAARAAEKASAKDIQVLAAAYADMERSADDNESFVGPDSDFHKAIVRSVENRMVDALGSVIEAALTISLRLSLNATRRTTPIASPSQEGPGCHPAPRSCGSGPCDGASDRQCAAGCADGARR